MSEESHYDQLMKNPEFAKAMVKEAANLEREICAEQLQAMEARAVAAEAALSRIKYVDSQLSFVGKMGILLSAELDEALKSIDFAAAREMMRKAEDANTLRRQLQEAEALVNKLRTGIINAYGRMAVWNDDINADVMPLQDDLAVEALKQLLKESRTPAAALAEYRREVLEEVAKLADTKAVDAEDRRAVKAIAGNINCADRWLTCRNAYDDFAAEIRAMKDAQ